MMIRHRIEMAIGGVNNPWKIRTKYVYRNNCLYIFGFWYNMGWGSVAIE